MKNLKKLAAGSAIALVIGASAIAGPMSTGSASADGHVPDELAGFEMEDSNIKTGYFELTYQEQPNVHQWQDISLKRGVTSDLQIWK